MIETGKLASIGELAAGIAHEINNPVAIMVEEAGWIQDLLEEEEFSESANLAEFERALTQINTQGKRCKEITHKLLSFARKTDSRLQQFAINDLIEEVIGLSQQRAKYAKVTITPQLADHLPAIQASPSEMQQVFLNLINNAVDAMEKEGGDIAVVTRCQGNCLVVEVQDTGPGIPTGQSGSHLRSLLHHQTSGQRNRFGTLYLLSALSKRWGAISVSAASWMKGPPLSSRSPSPRRVLKHDPRIATP